MNIKPEFIIREGIPSDGIAVRKIVFTTFCEYSIIADPDDDDRDIMEFGYPRYGVMHFVITFGGKVIGSSILTPYGREKIKLTKFYFDKAYRGMGAGRKMLEYVTERAENEGYKEIFLKARDIYKHAISLYERCGWIRGEPEIEVNKPNILYYKKL